MPDSRILLIAIAIVVVSLLVVWLAKLLLGHSRAKRLHALSGRRDTRLTSRRRRDDDQDDIFETFDDIAPTQRGAVMRHVDVDGDVAPVRLAIIRGGGHTSGHSDSDGSGDSGGDGGD